MGKVKKCYGCGSYTTMVSRQGDQFQVVCGGTAQRKSSTPYIEVHGGCGVAGPFAPSPKEAEQRWNHMWRDYP